MNTSLTEFLASLLILVAQTALPAVGSGQAAVLESPEPRAEMATAQDESPKTRQARKRPVGHTPYYDFGRRNPRAKD